MRTGDTIDQHERVAGYAACALLLDLLYTASNVFQTTDLDTVSIILCVMQNSLRDVDEPDDKIVALTGGAAQPNSARGISRRAIADKLGLSRETVRRRANLLLQMGILEEDEGGFIHASKTRFHPSSLDKLNDFHDCVLSYLTRLGAHQIAMPLRHVSKRA